MRREIVLNGNTLDSLFLKKHVHLTKKRGRNSKVNLNVSVAILKFGKAKVMLDNKPVATRL